MAPQLIKDKKIDSESEQPSLMHSLTTNLHNLFQKNLAISKQISNNPASASTIPKEFLQVNYENIEF